MPRTKTSRTKDTATDDGLQTGGTLGNQGLPVPAHPADDVGEKPHKTCSDGTKVGTRGTKKEVA
jgi:hypothetical protein